MSEGGCGPALGVGGCIGVWPPTRRRRRRCCCRPSRPCCTTDTARSTPIRRLSGRAPLVGGIDLLRLGPRGRRVPLHPARAPPGQRQRGPLLEVPSGRPRLGAASPRRHSAGPSGEPPDGDGEGADGARGTAVQFVSWPHRGSAHSIGACVHQIGPELLPLSPKPRSNSPQAWAQAS